MMRGFQSLWIGSSPSSRFFMVMVVLLSFLATKDTVDPRQKYEVFLNTHFKNCPGYPVVDDGLNWNIFDDYNTEIKNTSIPDSNVPGRVMLVASPSDANIIYAVIASGAFDDAKYLRTKAYAIIRSDDRGETWEKTGMPYEEERNWAYIAWHALLLEVDPNNPNVLYAGGLDLYKSVDGGNNWHKISDWTGMYGSEIDYTYVHGDLHKIAFMPGSSDFFIVGTDGGVFITNSGSDSI